MADALKLLHLRQTFAEYKSAERAAKERANKAIIEVCRILSNFKEGQLVVLSDGAAVGGLWVVKAFAPLAACPNDNDDILVIIQAVDETTRKPLLNEQGYPIEQIVDFKTLAPANLFKKAYSVV